jgi:LacI family transcriptional regulator
MSARDPKFDLARETGLLNRFLVVYSRRVKAEFATIRDVAKAARVSPATVSRHLNKMIVLPPGTAARIERACKRLAYRPNLLAKRLSLGSSELIGLVTPDIANPFFATLAAAAEDEARRLGYSLLIMSSGGDPQMEFAHIDRLDSRDIDGLIILTNRPDDGRLREIVDGRKDVVLLDEDVPGADVGRIFVENERGAYMATRHLLDAGHRRIAHVGGPRDLFSAQERFAGYARALAEAGAAVEDSLVRFGSYERTAGHSAVKDIMAHAAPTALFAGSDYLAIGALAALRELGLDAPRDLSLVGFDDMPFAEWLQPPLTTVRQPIEEMGRQGVRMLLSQIRDGAAPALVRLATELVERGSVAPLSMTAHAATAPPPQETKRRLRPRPSPCGLQAISRSGR